MLRALGDISETLISDSLRNRLYHGIADVKDMRLIGINLTDLLTSFYLHGDPSTL
ncbi:hypothetical protein K3495_g7514 [Podosphaera aphanis]|nr:hypothetical protein K3495_g7514 [Podosphaera aphanis]